MNTRYMLHTITAALTVSSAAAFAHGDEGHGARHEYDAGKVEETAFGHEGDPKKVKRTIKLGMNDTMRFTPAYVVVKRGDTVKFVVHNDGKLLHEMVLGTPQELKEHAEMMKRFPEMEHSSASMAHVKPGAAGEIVWRFTKPGEYQFGCLQPGHFEAGMVGKVVVK